MNRRDVLRRTVALAGVGTLAGCLNQGSGDDDGDGGGGGDGGSGGNGGSGTTAAPTDEPTPTIDGRSIATQGASCLGDAETGASAAAESLTVTVTGTIEAPDPCHEAALVGASYDPEADTVTVTVGTESGDAGACSSCVGGVEYEATVTFQGRLPATATVEHRVGDETTTVAEGEV